MDAGKAGGRPADEGRPSDVTPEARSPEPAGQLDRPTDPMGRILDVGPREPLALRAEIERGPGVPDDPTDRQLTVLRHPLCLRIVRLLEIAPGRNKSQIARSLDTAWSSVHRQLGRLEAADLVVLRSRQEGQEVVCFLPGDVDLWDEGPARVLFGRAEVRRVAVEVVRRPGQSTLEIAVSLSLAAPTVRHHLAVLVEHELVDRTRVGRRVFYEPTAILEAWVEEMEDRLDGNARDARGDVLSDADEEA